jgi:hypothetical protein
MGYKPRSNLVKDENGDLLADSHHFEKMVELPFSYLLDGNSGDRPRSQY